MIGPPVRIAADDEAAAAEPLQLVPVANGLPIPLNPSGHTPTSSPAASSRSASALQASVVPGLRLIGPTNGVWNTRSAPSIRSCRCAGWSSCSADRGHQRVERDGAGVVGDDQRATVVRHVVQARGLDPEPLPVERPQRRQDDVVGEVGVEAEVVDVVVAGQAAAQEGERVGECRLPLGRERGGGRIGGSGRR